MDAPYGFARTARSRICGPDTGLMRAYGAQCSAYGAPCSRRDFATVSSRFRPQVFLGAAREFFREGFGREVGSQNGSRDSRPGKNDSAGCIRQLGGFPAGTRARKSDLGDAADGAPRNAKTARVSIAFGRPRRDGRNTAVWTGPMDGLLGGARGRGV